MMNDDIKYHQSCIKYQLYSFFYFHIVTFPDQIFIFLFNFLEEQRVNKEKMSKPQQENKGVTEKTTEKLLMTLNISDVKSQEQGSDKKLFKFFIDDAESETVENGNGGSLDISNKKETSLLHVHLIDPISKKTIGKGTEPIDKFVEPLYEDKTVQFVLKGDEEKQVDEVSVTGNVESTENDFIFKLITTEKLLPKIRENANDFIRISSKVCMLLFRAFLFDY